MSAVTIVSAPSFRPARPLLDSRPRRGKHRQPLLERADRMLTGWKRIRAEVAVCAAAVGGVVAPLLIG